MNNLKEARERAGYNRKEVSAALGVSMPAISMWETGKNNPTQENYRKLSDLYGVSVDYLMGKTSELISDFSPIEKDPSAMSDREIQDELVKRIMQLDEAGRQRVKDFLAGMGAGV